MGNNFQWLIHADVHSNCINDAIAAMSIARTANGSGPNGGGKPMFLVNDSLNSPHHWYTTHGSLPQPMFLFLVSPWSFQGPLNIVHFHVSESGVYQPIGGLLTRYCPPMLAAFSASLINATAQTPSSRNAAEVHSVCDQWRIQRRPSLVCLNWWNWSTATTLISHDIPTTSNACEDVSFWRNPALDVRRWELHSNGMSRVWSNIFLPLCSMGSTSKPSVCSVGWPFAMFIPQNLRVTHVHSEPPWRRMAMAQTIQGNCLPGRG